MVQSISHNENCCPRDAEILEKVDALVDQISGALQNFNMEDIKKSMLGKMLGLK